MQCTTLFVIVTFKKSSSLTIFIRDDDDDDDEGFVYAAIYEWKDSFIPSFHST